MYFFKLPVTVLYFYKTFVLVTCISFWVYLFIQRKK